MASLINDTSFACDKTAQFPGDGRKELETAAPAVGTFGIFAPKTPSRIFVDYMLALRGKLLPMQEQTPSVARDVE